MLDLASKRVGALECWHARYVDGMCTGAYGDGVKFGDRDSARLLVAVCDLKPITGVLLNFNDVGIELDVRKQTEMRGKVVQICGIFLPAPQAPLLAIRWWEAGKCHVVLRHRQIHGVISCADRIVKVAAFLRRAFEAHDSMAFVKQLLDGR